MVELSIRAAIPKTALAYLDRSKPELAKAARDRLDPDVLERIETTIAVGWVPIDVHLDLVDLLHERVGTPGLQLLFCDVYVGGFSKLGAIEGFLNATLRMFKREPTSLARAMPRAWDSLSKGLGTFTVPTATSARTFEISYSSFGPPMSERPAWAYTFAGVLDGALRHVDATGHTTTDLSEWDQRRVTYSVDWTM